MKDEETSSTGALEEALEEEALDEEELEPGDIVSGEVNINIMMMIT